MGAGYALTDDEWTRLEPLLPVHRPGRGRPAVDHRRVIDALLWLARTGAPWRTLPERFGPWRTIATQLLPLDRKRTVGADHGRAAAPSRPRRQARLVAPHDRQHDRARAPARGRGKRVQSGQALGRSRGGFTTKIHLRCDREGRPLVLHLTSGERHDQTGFKALLTGLAIKRPQCGRPRSRPGELVADRGYTGAPIRQELKRRGIRAVIPTRSTEKRRLMLDRAAYAERNRVERPINRFKQYRRIATRYEKRADTFAAFLTLVAVRSWL